MKVREDTRGRFAAEAGVTIHLVAEEIETLEGIAGEKRNQKNRFWNLYQGKSEVVFREKTYGDLTIHRIENLGFTNLAVAFMRSILGDPFTTIRTLYRFCRMKDGFSSVADNISTRTKGDGKTQMKHINQITAQRCIIVPIGDSDEHMRCVEEFQSKSNT